LFHVFAAPWPDTFEWTKRSIPPNEKLLPLPRRGHCAAIWNHRLFVIHGEARYAGLLDIYSLDLTSSTAFVYCLPLRHRGCGHTTLCVLYSKLTPVEDATWKREATDAPCVCLILCYSRLREYRSARHDEEVSQFLGRRSASSATYSEVQRSTSLATLPERCCCA
jgi:hypothetical protein